MPARTDQPAERRMRSIAQPLATGMDGLRKAQALT